MNKFFCILIKILKKYAIAISPSLRIQPLELFKSESTDKPYVIVSPLNKYCPHNVFLEEIIVNKNLLRKLDCDSLCYLFYAYGILKASEKNSLYSLIEILPSQVLIRVKNIKTLTLEEWDKNKFNLEYMLLDKNSLKLATSFFSSFNKLSSLATIKNTYPDYLKLVK